jgi:hypothetical protein
MKWDHMKEQAPKPKVPQRVHWNKPGQVAAGEGRQESGLEHGEE